MVWEVTFTMRFPCTDRGEEIPESLTKTGWQFFQQALHNLLVTGHWSLITGHWSLVTDNWSLVTDTISKKLGYRLSPQPPFETGALVRRALVDRCVAPVDRNGIRWSVCRANWSKWYEKSLSLWDFLAPIGEKKSLKALPKPVGNFFSKPYIICW
jgi:hypothetical protein